MLLQAARDLARAAGVADVETALLPAAFASLSLTNYTPTSNASCWASCDLANATICPALEAGLFPGGPSVVVLLFNSRAQAASATPALLPVPILPGGGSYVVSDATGTPIVAQVR